jgi:MFS transporter, AAHS family, 4-hydroxybenzoate transporter
MASTVNVTDLIDRPLLTRFQICVVVLCALVALLDGFDTQSIGVAAPLIAVKLGLPTSSLGAVFSSALFGAMLGALTFGPIADRVGRKRVLVFATWLIAIFTYATALVDNYTSLMVVRFFSGLGLGGVLPCFLALTSEYAPKHRRTALVSLLWAGFPLGGMICGFLNAAIINRLGWQAIFYIGGILPMLVAIATMVWMPESLRFLMVRDAQQSRITRIVAQLDPSLATPGTRYIASEERLAGVSVRHLFTEGRALPTFLLWGALSMVFGILAVIILWTPALLRTNGIPVSATALIIGVESFGSILGSSFSGRLIERFGAARILIPALLIGAACTAALGEYGTTTFAAAVSIFFVGYFLGTSGGGTIAITAIVYPTAIRSTGIGWAMGAARLGQVVTPLVTAWMVSLRWDTGTIFQSIALWPVLAAACIAALHPFLEIGRRNVEQLQPAVE